MELLWLELTDFRSYHRLRIAPDPGINVLVGANGSGKTNLLEAAAYLTSLRSFREAPDEALINDEAEAAVVRGEVHHLQSASLIEAELPRTGRRRIRINGQRPARSTDLLGHVRGIVFLPDDLDIIKRGPAYRRDFLDAVSVQLWPGAYLDRQEFERALRQRNTLLRRAGREADEATLSVWDQRLSEAAGKLMVRRAAAAATLRDKIAVTYDSLTRAKTVVEMRYTSKWGGSLEERNPEAVTRGLAEALLGSRRADAEQRVTTMGPHRDEPWFTVNGRDARTRASQGEQRTLALSLRLASHHAVSEATGEAPLLLLDDVFSELDMARANALAGMLPAAQTFITTAREEEVPVHGRTFLVQPGSIT
ncbi:MAG: DNA replication/repair protein RecF [Acidimicrobiia bacterium]|nr:DNA replication/repair protein RecF [Acidimicrobiia bacterium]